MLKEKLAAQFDFLKAKAPPLVGCDISSSSVKMVEISERSRNVYTVERYAIEPLPKDTVVDGIADSGGIAFKWTSQLIATRIAATPGDTGAEDAHMLATPTITGTPWATHF